MRSPIVEKILKETPLDIRLRVPTEMAMIDLLCELSFREDKGWSDEEQPMLDKICECAKKLTDYHLKEIKKWEEDGRPKK